MGRDSSGEQNLLNATLAQRATNYAKTLDELDTYQLAFRALNKDDTEWLQKKSGVHNLYEGLVIAAPFNSKGNISRSLVYENFQINPSQAVQTLNTLIKKQNEILTRYPNNNAHIQTYKTRTIQRSTNAPNGPLSKYVDPVDYSSLGKVGIIGGTGSIGSAAAGILSGQNAITITSRKEPNIPLPDGVQWKQDLSQSDVDTVLIAASVPKKRGADGKFIIDKNYRNRMLTGYEADKNNNASDGNVGLIVDAAQTIPNNANVVIISNPTSTLAWLLQTLRPDLRVLANSGADFIRLKTRTRMISGDQEPVIFGLHSPNMIAIDQNRNNVGVIPYLGPIHAMNSCNVGATGPCALSAFDELMRFDTNTDSTTLALAINADDAAWLNSQLNRKDIPTGLVITGPFDDKGNLNRDITSAFIKGKKAGRSEMLKREPHGTFSKDIYTPEDNKKLLNIAIDELLETREQAMDKLAQILNKRMQLEESPKNKITTQWLLENEKDIHKFVEINREPKK